MKQLAFFARHVRPGRRRPSGWLCLLLPILLCAAVLPPAARAQAPGPDAAPPQSRVLVIGTKEAPPFAMKGEDGKWSGISIELWRRVADQLHLRYRLKETTLQGLIDETAAGTLDAAVAALTVTTEREQVVDFTQPFFATGLGIAVPRTAKFDWLRLFGSLLSLQFLEAMLALVGVTLLVGFVVWLLERRRAGPFQGVRGGLINSVWWSALTMTQAGAEDEPRSLAGRLVAIAWMGASVIAIAVFTAGITSQMTARQLQGLVHGVNDLKAARTGVVGGTASVEYLAKRGIRATAYPDPASGLTALAAGKLDAFVYDKPLLSWYVRERFPDSVDVLDVLFDKQTYAIAVPNGSPLRVPINLALLEAVRTPWWDELNARYLGAE